MRKLIDSVATLIDNLATLTDSLGTSIDNVATLVDSLATLTYSIGKLIDSVAILIERVIVLEWARRTIYQRDVFTKNHVFGRYFWTFLCLVELDNDLFRCRGVNLVKK